MKNILTIVLSILFSVNIFAQEDLTVSRLFFNKQLPIYTKWLSLTKISKVISISKLDINSDKVILNLKISSENDWHALKLGFNKDYKSLSEMLYFRFIHLMELKKEQAKIKITDNKKYFINIEFIDNELVVKESNPKGPVDNKIILPIIELNPKYIKPNTDNIKGNIQYVRQTIVKCLENYYSTKYARISSSLAQYKPIDTYGNYIDITISNITNEMIKDRMVGFFEYITIHIKIEQLDKEVKIDYTLQGKYGSGVFTAPHQNDYYDMESEYKNYLDNYNKTLKLTIRNYLLNN